ncbi:pRiA4b ORF-3-like protein [Lutibacter sp. Hel_I_33_5]|uniref:IS1096 element passenger TnpR family protein n=1 Tax=Lutibacter sp. Hel_I_33_5 TaxID=1566289 RepID=UPI0011A97D3F|nr:plasmid pRiA4b ORF-3 family protein [Lutibacter sp. Hel_I_33_5]TVZ55463.1 pRiA4b ORF-3-like protein [Lutibacter sp. Hel_I_33_5]
MYKVRVILDTQEDVIRTITINNTINLEDLHFTIAKAFGFNGLEMASFYRTDDEWNQGEEIPLFNMAEAGEGISMASCILHQTLVNTNDKLIYVYDFLHMWTFYVEVVDINNQLITESKTLLSVGEIPKEAPEKEFKAEDFGKDLDDEFKDDIDPYDDYDFNEY